jgi:hypothetical protein
MIDTQNNASRSRPWTHDVCLPTQSQHSSALVPIRQNRREQHPKSQQMTDDGGETKRRRSSNDGPKLPKRESMLEVKDHSSPAQIEALHSCRWQAQTQRLLTFG